VPRTKYIAQKTMPPSGLYLFGILEVQKKKYVSTSPKRTNYLSLSRIKIARCHGNMLTEEGFLKYHQRGK
jgi:hypothetical protein